jgi:hypothetical protein
MLRVTHAEAWDTQAPDAMVVKLLDLTLGSSWLRSGAKTGTYRISENPSVRFGWFSLHHFDYGLKKGISNQNRTVAFQFAWVCSKNPQARSAVLHCYNCKLSINNVD